jgi:ribosomal-protein-serine acetyltransferase
VTPTPLPDLLVDGDLVLRAWTSDDAPELHRLVRANLDHLRPWMPWIALEPQTVEQRAGWERDRRAGGDVVLGVFLDGEAIGGTGLHRRGGPDALEVGYWIAEPFTGRGLAQRLSTVLTTAAFEQPGVSHVRIGCDEANRASARVPEALGFTLVEVDDRPVAAPGETGRHRLYRVDRDDWLERSR